MATTVGNPFNLITFTRGTTATRVNSSGLIETVASGAQRLDYDPVTLEAKGLLIEEARTNLLTFSEDFSIWATSLVTVTSNYAISPSGDLTADRFVSVGGAYPQIAKSAVLTAGLSYTFSFWVKSDGTPQIQQTLILETSSATFTPTNTWTRVSVTIASSAGGSQTPVIATNNGSAPASSFLMWGAQLEAGAFATSYIPTTTTSAPRNADLAVLSTSAFPYSASEGTLIVYGSQISSSGTTMGNNRFASLHTSGGAVRLVDIFSVAPQFGNYKTSDTTQSSFGTWSQTAKVAVAYKLNDYGFAAGGVLGIDDTSTGVLSLANIMGIGNMNSGSFFNGWIKQITYLPRRLTNAELQAKTI
jgi:hypothetical protein